jgi:hypothetical protein
MTREILDRIQHTLKEAGFANFARHDSTHAWTLSAEKAGVRAVVHLTDREELPNAVGINAEVPAGAEVHLKAALPGAVTMAPGLAIGRTGRGGSLKAGR